MVSSNMRIKQICVYPIKSLRGCTPPSHTATSLGFSYDRRFMLQRVSDENNMIIGKVYEMCLFTTELYPAENPTTIRVRYTLPHAFDKPDQPVEDDILSVPLEPNPDAEGLAERTIELHRSPTPVHDMPEKYNAWFSARFGYPVRLIYVGTNRRQVLGNLAPTAPSSTQSWLGTLQSSVSNALSSVTGTASSSQLTPVNNGIGFSDVAPFLVVNDKSHADAASRLSSESLDVHKFRPNIIVEGADEAFEEDFWAELAIGEDGNVGIVLTANCPRCASLNVDWNTGKQGETEAGTILKLLQRDRRVDAGTKYSPIFGRYGFLARGGAGVAAGEDEEVVIRVGDPVRVVKRNESRTKFEWPGISSS